ncbi:MAG TPA: hypothetical protein VH087_08380 [Thermoanaerobaculia bacterium]|nr:hypothetical protein [Thermoanaerobaculia bacterium]
MHVNGDHCRDDSGEEGDELAREPAQHDARIFFARQAIELPDRRRQLDVSVLHRLEKERLFRLDVAEEGCRRNVQLARDVRQRRGFESLSGEDAARHRKQLGALDRCRASHL